MRVPGADEDDSPKDTAAAPNAKSKRGPKAARKGSPAPKQKKARLKQGTLEGGQLDAESDEDVKKKAGTKRPVLEGKVRACFPRHPPLPVSSTLALLSQGTDAFVARKGYAINRS